MNIKELALISRKRSRLVLGAMSGTSMDAISVVLCRITGAGIARRGRGGASVELLRFHDEPYPSAVKAKILKLHNLRVSDIAELNVQIGEAFAKAFLTTLKKARVTPQKVDLIGSHGQTIYHHSGVRVGSAPALKATLQLGDGDIIAERTGITVVSDFRTRDIAAGGEGAPLTPYADAVLFASHSKAKLRLILNLGGVANITVLDPNLSRIFGFDTGPANGPLDRLVRILSGGECEFDEGGKLARSGKVNEQLLASVLSSDKYLKRTPPKSTGFEMYGDDFVEKMIRAHGRADVDLLRTLTEFSARTVADAVKLFVRKPLASLEIVAAGGGVYNEFLMERIADLLRPAALCSSHKLGVPPQAREAMAFALFANDLICGEPVALPRITGCRYPTMLGKISLGR